MDSGNVIIYYLSIILQLFTFFEATKHQIDIHFFYFLRLLQTYSCFKTTLFTIYIVFKTRFEKKFTSPYVHMVHMFTWFICSYGSYVHMVHMFIWFTCSHGSYVHMVHMFIWFICSYGSYVHMVHMFIWFICSYGSHVHMVHMFIWFTCSYGSHVHMVHIRSFFQEENIIKCFI